jgi:hypothetical protein
MAKEKNDVLEQFLLFSRLLHRCRTIHLRDFGYLWDNPFTGQEKDKNTGGCFSIDTIFDCLNQEEQSVFTEYLERLINAAKKQLPGDEKNASGSNEFLGGRFDALWGNDPLFGFYGRRRPLF